MPDDAVKQIPAARGDACAADGRQSARAVAGVTAVATAVAIARVQIAAAARRIDPHAQRGLTTAAKPVSEHPVLATAVAMAAMRAAVPALLAPPRSVAKPAVVSPPPVPPAPMPTSAARIALLAQALEAGAALPGPVGPPAAQPIALPQVKSAPTSEPARATLSIASAPLADVPRTPILPAKAVRVGVAQAYRDRAPWTGAATAAAAALTPTAGPAPPLPSPPAMPRTALVAGPPSAVGVAAAPGLIRRVARAGRRMASILLRGTSILLRLAIGALLCASILWAVALLTYRFVDPPASTLMLGHYLTGRSIEQRWVPLDRISPNLLRTVIASEDGNFCRHRGVDWGALYEALDKAVEEGGRPRGASTISMQTVKNLLLWPQPHTVRKLLEMPLAYAAELVWGKRRMLELYLNIAEWGPGIFGAEAAAQYHFGKSAAQLSIKEATLLAVALPNPIERDAGRPGPGTQRLARLIETRSARPTLSLRCVAPPP